MVGTCDSGNEKHKTWLQKGLADHQNRMWKYSISLIISFGPYNAYDSEKLLIKINKLYSDKKRQFSHNELFINNSD